jgi:Rho GDP-dissociation inhibitor
MRRPTPTTFPPCDVPSTLTDDTNETDANDESLQRYKESLGLGGGKDLSDPSDPRTCIIKSLSLESPGRPAITIDLSQPGSEATLKDKPFTIKEGAKFTMVVTFKVQHEIISGLSYVQVVRRKGIRVSKDSEMLGSYGPNTDKQTIYTKRCEFPPPRVLWFLGRENTEGRESVCVLDANGDGNQQSTRKRRRLACSPEATTRPCRASWMTTRRSISSSSGALISQRTGEQEQWPEEQGLWPAVLHVLGMQYKACYDG